MRFLRKGIILLFILSLGIFISSKALKLTNKKPAPPKIVSTVENLSIPCKYTDEQIKSGLTASGEKDGDLTSKIMVGDISRFKSKGVAEVTYIVFDSDNQSASYTRNVTFSDYKSPEFYLTGPLVFQSGNLNYIDSFVGATDVFAGDITNALRFTYNDINYDAVGDYFAKAEVTNSYGDSAQLNLPVHIIDTANNSIQITLNKNLIYIKKNATGFNPMNYVESVALKNGDILDKKTVQFESNVDLKNTGVYEIKYSAKSGERKGLTWLTVAVTE